MTYTFLASYGIIATYKLIKRNGNKLKSAMKKIKSFMVKLKGAQQLKQKAELQKDTSAQTRHTNL
jgi:hypothetical protein